MTHEEQYKAWLEKVEGMRNVYNEIPKSDDVEPPTDGVMFPNPLDTLKGKPEPGRVKPISVPDGVDYYERLIRDYLKDRQEINYKQWSKESDEYKKWLQANEKENPCMMGTSRKIPCEPGRVEPISVPEGFDYYEWMTESLGHAGNQAMLDYLKNAQEINISKLKGIRDTIDHPPHYTSGKIEVWDFIADQGLDFFCGNVVKYICRAGRKGDKLEDLRKARAYVDKAIKNCGGE